MKYTGLIEESVKIAVRDDFFSDYKYTQLGRIDFVIAERSTERGQFSLFDEQALLRSILWAEAKQGTTHDIYESFVQLILTIGKERTFEKYLPPKFIGAFDSEKIAFIEYHDIQTVFYQNDFNWNVTPSNHNSKEFKQLLEMSKSALEASSMLFYYEAQEKELREFIAFNFRAGADITEKIAVTKNNFPHVFNKWLESVKPTIAVDWERVNRAGIISADFFLADLISSENQTLRENLFVVLQKTKYELARKIDEETGLFDSKKVGFSDGQKAHRAFWAIYERPPKEEYWDEIIERRDLLVPQDIRERKGSFFTPQIWVEKSQEYLADVLGENWQDEYYIWDCSAGTGNLLNGLVNPRNVWASTLDKADVDVMKDRIANGWTMFENHVFQFDFLNDEFAPQDLTPRPPLQSGEGVAQSAQKLPSSARIGAAGEVKGKLPNELYEIIADEEKRKKLVIYINPPYAEATSTRTIRGTSENKTGVATTNKTYQKYKNLIGKASNELFAQFFIRIAIELRGCILGEFSKLKILQAQNFDMFRSAFDSSLKKSFLVPADTFDNVSGKFPIGFFIWDTNGNHSESIDALADAYDSNGKFLEQKRIFVEAKVSQSINKWIKEFDTAAENIIGYMENPTPDLQNNKFLCIINSEGTRHNNYSAINCDTLIVNTIYFAVRWCIKKTWLNDRDQFLFPRDGWQSDREFQSDCLVFTLFHGQNRISTDGGKINHWIPFTEAEVGSKKSFASDFMAKFIKDFQKVSNGLKPIVKAELFAENTNKDRSAVQKTEMSSQAAAVYSAGLELWRYYFKTAGDSVNENASFYDIRKHFQGVDGKGRMNNKSDDVEYNQRIETLRNAQKKLAAKIAEKVYEYGFLRK